MTGRVNKSLFRQLIAGLSVSLGGFSFASVNGWVTPLLPYFLSPDSEVPMTSVQASWMVSIPDLSGLFTPIPAAMLADWTGRKPLILLSAVLYTLGWVMILTIRTYFAFLAARFIQGGAGGIVSSVIPVYAGEIASTKYRGAMTSLFFFFFWLGHLFQYSTGPYMSMTNYTLVSMAPTVLFFVLFLFQPETPYFYLMKNKPEVAQKSLEWLRGSTKESVNEELERIKVTVEEDMMRKTSWREVVATPTDRKALYILLFAGFLRVSCGVVTVVSYATEIFLQTPNISISANVVTIILGVVLVIGSSISSFIIDTVGRRPLLIYCCLISSVCLCVVSVIYYLQQETNIDVSSFSLVPPVVIIMFTCFAVTGIVPISSAYVSELFNSKTRSFASSLNTICFIGCAFLLRLSYGYIVDAFGEYFNFMLFTIVNVVGCVVSYLYMPETRNKTFEQIRKELNSS